MAQLRIRKKPTEQPRPGATLVPMAAVLAAGILTTLFVGNGTQRPAELAAELTPAAGETLAEIKEAATAAKAALAHQALSRRSFEVEGRAWILADHPPVTAFARAEMVPVATVDGAPLFANRRRGLAALGTPAKAFDRLYLELAPGRYAPLRWRDVPTR